MKRSPAVLASSVLLLGGCAAQPADPAAGGTATSGGERYAVSATVLESPDHGPQLCSSVMESYPPQCGGGGPDVVGFDWAEGEESASGTTWGAFRVVGTWDGD